MNKLPFALAFVLVTSAFSCTTTVEKTREDAMPMVVAEEASPDSPEERVAEMLRSTLLGFTIKTSDEQMTRLFRELATGLEADDVPVIEELSSSPEFVDWRWSIVISLVEMNELGPAARLMMAEVRGHARPREELWKAWLYFFGKRRNYDALSLRIGLALVDEFGSSSPADRALIAKIFGRGEQEFAANIDTFRSDIVKKLDGKRFVGG